MCDPLARVLLLQVRTLLQNIVINSPWEDRAGLMKQRQKEKDGKYHCVKQSIGRRINYSCCGQQITRFTLPDALSSVLPSVAGACEHIQTNGAVAADLNVQ